MVGPISNWHVMFSKIKYLWIYFKYVIKGKCGSKNKQCLRIVKTLPSELISGFHVFVLEYRHSSTLQSSLIFPAGIIWCTCGYSWGFFSKLPSVIIYRITAAEGMAESYTLCIIRTGILIYELSRWLIWDVIIMLMVRISSQEGNFVGVGKGEDSFYGNELADFIGIGGGLPTELGHFWCWFLHSLDVGDGSDRFGSSSNGNTCSSSTPMTLQAWRLLWWYWKLSHCKRPCERKDSLPYQFILWSEGTHTSEFQERFVK